MSKYLKVWRLLTQKSAQVALESRFGSVIFVLGKTLRIVLMFVFILVILSQTKQIAGYSIWQIIFFYATFNLIDTLPQFFLREVYRFRSYVVSGDFDYFLVKPLSPLFRVLFGGADILDSFMIFLIFGPIIVSAINIPGITVGSVFLYSLLIVNALIIAIAFHIMVAALGIITTEVDSVLWIYRDLTQMGRFPIDIYREPLSFIVTFVIPVGIMMTFPAKAAMGILSITSIVASFGIGAIFLTSSLHFWKYALSKYASASS